MMCHSNLIFSIPKLISFLSRSSTLPAGTGIIAGIPARVGVNRSPNEMLKHGDEFAVEVLPYIGTLINVFENEE
jgi:2-keto-4-pentenoate hydratase/2-oxohepta-3-ene-1,7-dioic acid hydratase in catechol pathway